MSSYADLTEDIAKSILLAYTPAGVIVDIKDTIAAAYNLYDDPHSDENKFDMILCMLGWIQGPGDALKIGFRGINKNPELLFDMVRFILQKLGEHADAEAWLDGMLKDSKIRGAISGARRQTVQYIKDSDLIWDAIIPTVESVFNMVESNLSSFIMLLANRVLYWKSKTPKTTQQHAEISKSPAANSAQKTTYPKGKVADKPVSPEKPKSSGKKAGSVVNAVIKQLSNADIGVVGEHMADYWVAKELGVTVSHDHAESDRKVSRGGALHKLSITDVTGTGIDSIWKSNNHKLALMNTKTYAVIEAKCSGAKAASTPAGLLNDNTPKPKAGKTGPSKRGGTETKKPKELKNQQMSKEWVINRLPNKSPVRNNYSRHLVFYGNLNSDVLTHFEALAKNPQEPIASTHTAHKPSQTWGDEEIDTALTKRIERSKK
jgi:hypothetical protein